MILYLYGPDSYRRGKILNEKILASYVRKHPNGMIDYFDLEKEAELDRAIRFSHSSGLFSLTKLGVLLSPEKAEEKVLISFLKDYLQNATTTLVLISEKKLAKKFDFLNNCPVKGWEFKTLSENDTLPFIKGLAKERGIELKSGQIRGLSTTFGSDLWAISGEIDKMALGGVEANSFMAPEFITSIKDFVYSKDITVKLKSLYFLLDRNEPAAVFNMAAAWTNGAQKVLFADYDVAIKSGKLEFEEALLALALK